MVPQLLSCNPTAAEVAEAPWQPPVVVAEVVAESPSRRPGGFPLDGLRTACGVSGNKIFSEKGCSSLRLVACAASASGLCLTGAEGSG